MRNPTIAVNTTAITPPPCFPCHNPSQTPGYPDCKIEQWSNDSLVGDYVCPLPSSNGKRCPWVDVQEQHHGEKSDTISGFLFFVCLFTILANILLFYIILSQKELRVQRNLQFLISIGCGDMANVLAMLIVNQPLSQDIGRYIPALSSSPGVCRFYQFIAQFIFIAPWFSFLGLMMDRLYAIKRPVDYRNNLKSGVSTAIFACWALALVPTIPIWFDTTITEDWENGCKCYFPLRNKVWLYWSFTTSFFIPTGIIVFIWVIMAHYFAKMCKVLRNVTLKIVFITALFLVSIMPVCYQLIKAAIKTPTITLELDKSLIWALLNSMAQPVLCIVLITQIRQEFVRIICCRLNKTAQRQQTLRQQSTFNRSKTFESSTKE